MSKEITIHSYANNGVNDIRPRRPLVHLLAVDEYGDVKSISFHPDDAPAVTAAILAAGKSAAAGRKRKPRKIELKPHS